MWRGLRIVEAMLLAVSVALFASGLVLVHRPLLHAGLMASGLLVFYATIASGYVTSLSLGSRLVRAATLLHAALYALSWLTPLAYAAASLLGLVGVAASYYFSRRLPLLHAQLALLYSCGSVSPLLSHDGLSWLFSQVVVVPGAAIIPVNSFAVVKTYGVGSRWGPLAGLAAEALLVASGVAVSRGLGLWRLLLALGSMVYAVYAWLLVVGALRSRVYRSARGVARASHAYLLYGELVAPAYALLVAACSLACDEVSTIHALVMGYVGVHIAIHAPMMLPPVLGVKAARRYTPLPYALLAAAVASRLLGGGWLATSLLAAGFVATLAYASVDVWPPLVRRSGRG